MVSQAIVAEFCRSGAIERSIETVKEALRERRDVLCAALERELPDARFVVPEGGYFLWVDLPEGTDVAALAELAAGRGVVFVKGTDFLLEGGESALRIAYSGVQRRPDRRRRGPAGRRLPRAGRRRGVNDGPGLDLGQPRDVGALLRDGLRLYAAHLPLLLLMAAAIVVPFQLVVSGMGLEQLTAAYDDDSPWRRGPSPPSSASS